MRVATFTLLIAVLATAGCGGGAPEAQEPTRFYPHSDQEIARLVYSGTPRTPEGFDLEPDTGASYTSTTHLKNGDSRYELCTDDWSQALAWEEGAASQQPDAPDLVATNAEARYFEFIRV